MLLDYVTLRSYSIFIHFEPNCMGKMVRWNGDASQIGTVFAVAQARSLQRRGFGFVFLTVSTVFG